MLSVHTKTRSDSQFACRGGCEALSPLTPRACLLVTLGNETFDYSQVCLVSFPDD